MILIWMLGLFSTTLAGQTKVENESYFKKFLNSSKEKSLIILGENHASKASSTLYPFFVEQLNKQTGLTSLLVEFGPAEAYFYNKFLETGNEKHLNYTLYAGAIREWREAWKELYEYNKTLAKPLKVIGIDFDRTRTMAYAIYSIFLNYKDRPEFIETLMKEISSPDFYNSYTIGYPNAKDIAWANKTKDLLRNNIDALKDLLSEKDMHVMSEILKNKAVNYAEGREEAIAENTKRIILESDDTDFFLLVGRNHAYIKDLFTDNIRLAQALKEDAHIKVLTGVILYENSDFSANKDKPLLLFEISKKDPWKEYYTELSKKAKGEFTIVPFRKKLSPLTEYLDYVLIARDQVRFTLLNPKS